MHNFGVDNDAKLNVQVSIMTAAATTRMKHAH
jgi:hypothetical protein